MKDLYIYNIINIFKKSIIKIIYYIFRRKNYRKDEKIRTGYGTFCNSSIIMEIIQNVKCEPTYNYSLLVNHSKQCIDLNSKTDAALNDNINSWEDFRQRCVDKLNEKEDPNKKDMLEEFFNSLISQF